MAGDVTIGALQRMTFMPGLANKDGGDLIAGQYYYNVLFTGGSLSNVTLTNATINSLLYNIQSRVVTVAGTITGTATDGGIFVNKTSGAATEVDLPASPGTNQVIMIKDLKGDANTNNITVKGNGNTIDGGTQTIIGAARGWVWLWWNSVEWSVVG